MLDAAAFRALYALLAGDQTIDDDGRAVDCGVRCGKFCCSPTKYLLPGERAFLQSALDERTDDATPASPSGRGFTPLSLDFFDSIADVPGQACACENARDLRPFNCRMFPYSPRVDDRGVVVGLKKGALKLFEPCWITTPAPAWEKDAVRAWQMVLDDADNVAHFAKLTTLWDWHQAVERGDDPGHVLGALADLADTDDDERRARALRFFSRTDP